MASTDQSVPVSVVIPCYNGVAWIERAVQSVRNQHYKNLETIIIDDGSTDDTPKIIGSLTNVISRVVRNQGACAARNTGLALATGQFVLFLDADDYIDPESLEEWMKCSDEADIILGPFAHERGGQRFAGQGPGPDENAISIACQWLSGTYTPSCSVLWRTSFIRTIRGWDDGLLRNQDAEAAIRGLLSGARVRVANLGCGVYVHHHDGDRISKRLGRRVFVSEFSALEKLWALAQTRGWDQINDAFAGAFYRLAYYSFAMGVEDIGELALGRARQLGLKGHLGSCGHRMLSGLLGLRNKLLMTGILKGRRGITCTAE